VPFTFLAHQAFVLPLKWAWPRTFDGTALCVGSMAPDLGYALVGTPLSFPTHTLPAQVLWSVPVTVGLTLVWRHRVTQLLGDWLGVQRLRDLSLACRSWAQTLSSALIGALSHVFVDGFTHRTGWAVPYLPLLREELVPGVIVAQGLQYAGHIVGSLLGLALLVGMEVSEEHAEARLPSPSFRNLALLGALLAVPAAASALLTGGGLPVALMRATWALLLGLAAGAWLAR
jgi:hypothetical protein